MDDDEKWFIRRSIIAIVLIGVVIVAIMGLIKLGNEMDLGDGYSSDRAEAAHLCEAQGQVLLGYGQDGEGTEADQSFVCGQPGQEVDQQVVNQLGDD